METDGKEAVVDLVTGGFRAFGSGCKFFFGEVLLELFDLMMEETIKEQQLENPEHCE